MKREDVAALVRYRFQNTEKALADAMYLLEGRRSTQSIINRSYYAMFYAGLALVQTLGKTASKHQGILSLFDREFVHTNLFPTQFSRDFHRAFDLRQMSDYKVSRSPNEETAKELTIKAQRFVQAVKQFLIEHNWL